MYLVAIDAPFEVVFMPNCSLIGDSFDFAKPAIIVPVVYRPLFQGFDVIFIDFFNDPLGEINISVLHNLQIFEFFVVFVHP